MIDTKELSKKYEFVVGFNRKEDKPVKHLSEQDKKHIRILATLQLAKDRQIQHLLDNEFVEHFLFDEEKQIGYYCVRLIRKRGKDYADC